MSTGFLRDRRCYAEPPPPGPPNTPKNPVVAIDGPAGSGKSTVARAVADALGLPGPRHRRHVPGAHLGRARRRDRPRRCRGGHRAGPGLDLDVGPPVRVGGRDVNDAIRTAEVTAAVSVVAAVPEARVVLVAAQREWIEVHGGGVVEGRDIGTVVAPDAVLKIYLVASEEERARRRLRQDVPRWPAARRTGFRRAGHVAPEATTGETPTGQASTPPSARRRDAIDSGRAASPLAAADDAVVLDTTGLSVDGVVAEVLARYRAALEAAERP